MLVWTSWKTAPLVEEYRESYEYDQWYSEQTESRALFGQSTVTAQ